MAMEICVVVCDSVLCYGRCVPKFARFLLPPIHPWSWRHTTSKTLVPPRLKYVAITQNMF